MCLLLSLCECFRNTPVGVSLSVLSVVIWSAETVVDGSTGRHYRLSYRVVRNFWGPELDVRIVWWIENCIRFTLVQCQLDGLQTLTGHRFTVMRQSLKWLDGHVSQKVFRMGKMSDFCSWIP